MSGRLAALSRYLAGLSPASIPGVAMQHNMPHPLAGRTVMVKPSAAVYGRGDTAPFAYRVEDWNDRVFGRSWMTYEGHPASLGYAVRSATGGLPLDNEVVYGKDDGGIGHLIHVSELAE